MRSGSQTSGSWDIAAAPWRRVDPQAHVIGGRGAEVAYDDLHEIVRLSSTRLGKGDDVRLGPALGEDRGPRRADPGRTRSARTATPAVAQVPRAAQASGFQSSR